MSLPNPSMSFTPFDILTASEMNYIVDNIEALSLGTGLEDGAVTPQKLATLGRAGQFTRSSIGTQNVTVGFRPGLVRFTAAVTTAGSGAAYNMTGLLTSSFHRVTGNVSTSGTTSRWTADAVINLRNAAGTSIVVANGTLNDSGFSLIFSVADSIASTFFWEAYP